jgi:hypothetical protein
MVLRSWWLKLEVMPTSQRGGPGRQVWMRRYDQPMESIEDTIRIELLDLMAGLPSPCECPAPFPVESMTKQCTLCEWCGGLIDTLQARVERGDL